MNYLFGALLYAVGSVMAIPMLAGLCLPEITDAYSMYSGDSIEDVREKLWFGFGLGLLILLAGAYVWSHP